MNTSKLIGREIILKQDYYQCGARTDRKGAKGTVTNYYSNRIAAYLITLPSGRLLNLSRKQFTVPRKK